MRSDEELDDDEETGLTEGQRGQRTRRKEQNAQLDGHVSGAASIRSGVESTRTAEEKLVSATMLKNIIVNALLIALWYSFSISISVYNKWMFSKENLDFHFPLFVTSIHMIVQFILASSVLFFIPRFRPGADPTANPHDPSYRQLDGAENENTRGTTKPKQPLMSKWFYLTRIGPCGTSTALDIGLGNFSLRFISLTFFTMCKSSVLAFVLLFAFLFHLEQPTWRLCLIILLMTVGVIMMVAGETSFNALGFVLVMSASLCSGFRWSLTQILLLRNRATSNPFSTIFFLTPVMFVALFALALPIEGPSNVIEGIKELAKSKGGFFSFVLMLFPGFLAFMMVAAEFALLKRTSVVTLSVCGIFKEVLTISAAGIVFGDDLSPVNVSGLVVTIASIAAYNYLKWSKMKQDAIQGAHEIVVEERVEAREPRQKDAVADGLAEGDESTRALMSDDLHVLAEDDDVHPSKANGVIVDSPGRRPDDLG
jgi:solute carrier family 35 protein C2